MDQTYRLLVIEDSDREADLLRAHIDRYAAEQHICMSVQRLSSAADFDASSHNADIIFMDIDLPGETGMEAAESLRDVDGKTPFIFVTNLAQYALHSYAVNAIGFINKSASHGNFCLCMDRAMRAARRTMTQTLTISARDGSRTVITRDLVWVKAKKRELTFHLIGGEAFNAYGTIGELEKELTAREAPFVRISTSCLANVEHIRHISGSKLEMSDNTQLCVSHGKRKPALAYIAMYLGGA